MSPCRRYTRTPRTCVDPVDYACALKLPPPRHAWLRALWRWLTTPTHH